MVHDRVWYGFKGNGIAALSLLIDVRPHHRGDVCLDKIVLLLALRFLQQRSNEFNSRAVTYETQKFTMLRAVTVSCGLPMASAPAQTPGSGPSE